MSEYWASKSIGWRHVSVWRGQPTPMGVGDFRSGETSKLVCSVDPEVWDSVPSNPQITNGQCVPIGNLVVSAGCEDLRHEQ